MIAPLAPAESDGTDASLGAVTIVPLSADTQPTRIEAALRHQRLPLFVLLIAVPAVAWLWIGAMARDMYGSMSGPSAWMMTPAWDARHLALLWAMWAVMMTAMMLPSAVPALLLFGMSARRKDGEAAATRIYLFALGYLVTWSLFSLVAVALQRLLGRLLVLSPMMEASTPRVSAVLLLIAGIYQFTPLKLACLSSCQAPLGFFMRRWRKGTAGALKMGMEHGAFCVGCCWALMLLLFAGGVMNLAVILALTAFVAFEKLVPMGPWSSRASGALLIAIGVWMFVR